MQVEKSPVDHSFRPERDVGGGLIFVRVELDSAETIARSQGDAAAFLVEQR